MANQGNKIVIVNFKQVIQHLKNLDLTDKKNLKQTRAILKKPFYRMAKASKSNLDAQGSIRTGNLRRGLSVGSKFSKAKGYITVAFGSRAKATNKNKPMRKAKKRGGKPRGAINHFHLVNSGTKKRMHRNFKKTGAVGKAKNKNAKGMNPRFKIGFADRAIKPLLPTLRRTYTNEFSVMLSKIKTRGV